MAGFDRTTGSPLGGFEHVVQSIHVILETPKGSRIMRREFGSDIPDLIDRAMNQENVAGFVFAIADALDRWEPRFVVQQVLPTYDAASGSIGFDIDGVYVPDGHLRRVSVGPWRIRSTQG